MENKDKEQNKFINFVIEKKKLLIIITSILVVGTASTMGYIFSVKKNVESWNDKIYNGITAYGVDLSGKNRDEAIEAINNYVNTDINNRKINVNVENNSNFELSYGNINCQIDIEKMVTEALEYGKDAGLFEKNSIIKKGVDHKISTELTYDEGKVNEFVESINNSVKVAAKDAEIVISGGNINITEEVLGKEINVDSLSKQIKESINIDSLSVTDIEVNLEDYKPKITAEELRKINGILGSFSSRYTNDNAGRVTNMRLATNSVNGTLLMPGDEFSYNNTIGLTTEENGYKQAGTYVGTEVVQEYGGGVCHISTALYRAVMKSNLRSTLRYNHSMMVAYAEPSLDATVYEGDIDYRFVNTYDFPVYIEGYMTSNSVVFNVYGNKEALGNKTYDLVNEVIEKIDFTTEYRDDASLAEGTQVVKVNGAAGYRSKGYLVTYENGVEVNRELISTDYYAPMNTIISRGVKKAQPVASESQPSGES